ncbi:MAG: hypothetical protein MJY62_03455 [Bacteroidales bacterium]|nr:hypothetical protein [Bacteroidales bacterium]
MKADKISKLIKKDGYQWKFCSMGGIVRVNIQSGEDIAHLGELDQKLWTVLSCPIDSLEFDMDTLKMIDTDNDGYIKVPEVVSAAKVITDVFTNKDKVLEGCSEINLDDVNKGTEDGAKFASIAERILKVTGKSGNTISAADIAEVIASENHYNACVSYEKWVAAGEADAAIKPYGADTAAALGAVEGLSAKIADYFMRCKLINFNADCAASVDVSAEAVALISGENLSENIDKIAKYPLSHPSADGVLLYTAINPALKAQFDNLKALVLDKDYPGATGITEAQWNSITAKFGAYKAWIGSKAGAEVEGDGIEAVKIFISENARRFECELPAAAEIDYVNKVLHLSRDFYQLLRNYVVLSDFYANKQECKAIFNVGKLYIDQRCCSLCLKVKDMGGHADMANLSGMFLIYCQCVAPGKAPMNIVAVLTEGSVTDIRVGKNAVFYDNAGLDWRATVTKVVDNPISIKQAFWSPYRKLGNFITDKISKNAAEKESKSIANLQETADKPAAGAVDLKTKFDIAKFAGIFAAIGMAVGYIGQFIGQVVGGVKATPAWQTLLIIFGIMLVISGPSCFLAWLKLRKRNLGPVLNANGWAINAAVLVNNLFGKTLTSSAKYPIVKVKDPFAKKGTPAWVKILVVAVLVLAGLYLFGKFEKCGLKSPISYFTEQTITK